MKTNKNLFSYLAVFTYFLCFQVCAENSGHQYKPENHLLVFMANGIYDPSVPPAISVSGDYFDSQIMQRNEAEKLTRQDSATEYFLERFGVQFFMIPRTPVDGADLVGFAIDPNSPTGINQAVILVHGYQDQRWDYRAFVIDDKKVQSEGHKVHDASYSLVVTDPSGFTFYGSWGGVLGTNVPAATVAVHGEYLIEHPHQSNKNIHIRWESSDPIFDAFNPAGFTFDCAMHNDKWGDGNSFGRSLTRLVGSGPNVQTMIRNVITFPAPISIQ